MGDVRGGTSGFFPVLTHSGDPDFFSPVSPYVNSLVMNSDADLLCQPRTFSPGERVFKPAETLG